MIPTNVLYTMQHSPADNSYSIIASYLWGRNIAKFPVLCRLKGTRNILLRIKRYVQNSLLENNL